MKKSNNNWYEWTATKLHSPLAALAILIISFIATAVAWRFSHWVVEKRARERFEIRVNEIEQAIVARMHVYEEVLWSGVGLLRASSSVSRLEWKEFVSTLKINEKWPGIQGIGLSVPVLPNDRQSYIEAVRAEGFPEFTISPEGERAEYSSILYLEPFDWRNQRAFGYDMWSNDIRREAMMRTRDSGTATMSGMVKLVQETDKAPQKGVLLYVPWYQNNKPTESIEERQSAFKGWVYAPFRIGDLMEGLLGSEEESNIEFEIFDGLKPTEETLLLDTNERSNLLNKINYDAFSSEKTITLQGRNWTIKFLSKPDFIQPSETLLSDIVGGIGVIIDLLLFYVITALSSLHKRAKRLAEGMTTELIIAKEGLENTVGELSQFAYVVSHDLKAPLRGVSSIATWLVDDYGDKLGEEGRAQLRLLTNRVGRMHGLIEGILQYSRVGRENLEVTAVNLNDAVDSLFDLLSIPCGIKASIDTPLPTILFEKVRINQIFQNLLSNAVKYMGKATGEIHVGCQNTPHEIQFYVRDTGLGIDERYFEKIFQLFQTLHPKDEYESTGVGLALVKKIVEGKGGKVWVESVVGKGSTFWFSLPNSLLVASTDPAGYAGEEARADI